MKIKDALTIAKEKKLVPVDFKTNCWITFAKLLNLKQDTPVYACRAVELYVTTGELSDLPSKEDSVAYMLEKKKNRKLLKKARKPKEELQKKLDRQEFYKSREWRELRYLVLSHYKNICMCCGARPPDVVLHVDHIKPISLFPKLCLVFNNLQILCEQCNLGKSNLDMKDFRQTKFFKNT